MDIFIAYTVFGPIGVILGVILGLKGYKYARALQKQTGKL